MYMYFLNLFLACFNSLWKCCNVILSLWTLPVEHDIICCIPVRWYITLIIELIKDLLYLILLLEYLWENGSWFKMTKLYLALGANCMMSLISIYEKMDHDIRIIDSIKDYVMLCSLRSGDAYEHQWTGSSLVQVIYCHLKQCWLIVNRIIGTKQANTWTNNDQVHWCIYVTRLQWLLSQTLFTKSDIHMQGEGEGSCLL